MTTYHEWRAMWDRSGPWRPTVDDVAVLLTEIDRHTHPDPGEHPNFRDTAEWLTVPGRTFSLDGVVYEVREVEDEDGGHPADTEPTAERTYPYTATCDGCAEGPKPVREVDSESQAWGCRECDAIEDAGVAAAGRAAIDAYYAARARAADPASGDTP